MMQASLLIDVPDLNPHTDLLRVFSNGSMEIIKDGLTELNDINEMYRTTGGIVPLDTALAIKKRGLTFKRAVIVVGVVYVGVTLRSAYKKDATFRRKVNSFTEGFAEARKS